MNEVALYAPIVGVAFATARPDWFSLWYDLILWLETKGNFCKFISKPIGGCAVCTSGLLAFVWSLFTTPSAAVVNASAAIILAAVLNKVYQWSQ